MSKLNRTLALKTLQELIEHSFFNELTMSDFKHITDEIQYETYNPDMEAYLKSKIISSLFQNLEYYKIEDFLITFSTYIVRLTSSSDGYNVLSRLLSALVNEILLGVSRRIEIEVLLHLFNHCEMYYRDFHLFNESVPLTIVKNICDANDIANLDVAENYKYNQITIPESKDEQETMNELVSKTNFNKKEKIRKQFRKYVVNKYNEDSLRDFCNALTESIISLNIHDIEKDMIIKYYQEALIKLSDYAKKEWATASIKDEQQLSLFNYFNT